MKARWIVLLVCLAAPYVTKAQNFWVIETNPKFDFTVIKFYDEQIQLLHEEKLEGRKLDVRLRSDRKFLNRKLKEVNKQKANASARRATKARRG